MAENVTESEIENPERRKRQRFVAKRWGSVCFWIRVDGERIPLNDLSLEGFSVPAEAPLSEPKTFPFVLQIEGIPDEVRGEARTMNFVVGEGGGQLGCRFLSFVGDGGMVLHDWLTAHLISTATLRISEKEAAAIVAGPSLI